MSLSLSIRNHEREEHGILSGRTLEEIEQSTQFWKLSNVQAGRYSEPNALCSGKSRPTYLEHEWLAKQGVKWDGDTRLPEELAARYKEYGTN